MGFRKQIPGETGPKGKVTWSALKLDPGGHEEGFVLAECLWFWSHWRGRSVPCYKEFTDGKAECAWCNTRDYWQGYLPFATESGERFVALVKEANRPVTDKLQVGHSIMVARKKSGDQRYVVRPGLVRKVRVPTEQDEHALSQIEPALCILWRDEFFKDWIAKNGDPGSNLKLALEVASRRRREADQAERTLKDSVQATLKVRERTAAEEPVTIGDSLPHLNGVLKKPKG